MNRQISMTKRIAETYKKIGLTLVVLFLNSFVSVGLQAQSFDVDWTSPLISSDSCTVHDMVVDEINGELYVVGSFKGDMSSVFPTGVNGTFDFSNNYGESDGFVAKYDLSSNLIWAFYVGGPGEDVVKAIDISDAGNFYITGNFDQISNFKGVVGFPNLVNGSFGGVDIFEASYSSSGQLAWLHEDGGPYDDDATDVKYVEGYNRVVFTGNYYNQGQFGGISIGVANNSYHTFVLGRYDNGLTHWLNAPDGSGDELSVELAVKDNDVYLVGEFVENFTLGSLNIPNVNTDEKAFCLKMDAFGNLDWLTSFSATGSLNLEDSDIHLTSDRIFLSGSYTGQIEDNTGVLSAPSVGEDCFILEINENSNQVSGIKTFHSDLASGLIVGKSITQLPNNEGILLACDFSDSFQPEPGVTVSATSQNDGIIMLVNILGDHRANVVFNSVGNVDMSSIYLDENLDLFHSENWSQSLDLQTTNFGAPNDVNGAVGKLALNLPCYFDYGQKTFCDDTSIVYIDSVAMQYGNFYNLDGNISVNTSTGQLNIGTSNITTGSYVYHQNIGCIDSVLITVVDRFDPSLLVVTYEYCQADLNIDLSSFITGDAGGLWSGVNVVGSDLVLSSTQTGVFQFQYDSPVGHFCPSAAVDSIQINPVFDPSWVGLSGDFCVNDADIVLSTLITGDTGGTFLINNNIVDTLVFADFTPGINAIQYVGVIGNCAADSITQFEIINGSVDAGIDDTVCDLNYELSGMSSQNSVVWTALNSGVNITNDMSITTNVEVDTCGPFSFELFIQNGMCDFRDTVVIEFLRTPNLDAGMDQIVTEMVTDLQGSGNASTISWITNNTAFINDPNAYTSEVSNLEVGENEFIISGENQFCAADPDTVIIVYQNITVPNAFSPNGDGFNDTFELIGLDTYERVRLTILTKWGEVLISMNDYQNDWNGAVHNRPLAEGVYFYMLDFDGNQTEGFVEIKR